MNTKKLIAITLILILVFSLASCNSGGSKSNSETPGIPEVAAAPVTAPDEGNGTEDEKDAEEEIIEDTSDEPPFLKTLRSGVYGYDALVVVVSSDGERTTEQSAFVYSDGSRAVVCRFDKGEIDERCIHDYENNMSYQFFERSKSYRFVENHNILTLNLGMADFRVGQIETGRGTEDFFGETLDYINYGAGEDLVRVFIKEGDIYAMKTREVERAAYYVLKTYSSPPTMEYFDISNMNDYELIPSR